MLGGAFLRWCKRQHSMRVPDVYFRGGQTIVLERENIERRPYYTIEIDEGRIQSV
jgi:hypothetical protein